MKNIQMEFSRLSLILELRLLSLHNRINRCWPAESSKLGWTLAFNVFSHHNNRPVIRNTLAFVIHSRLSTVCSRVMGKWVQVSMVKILTVSQTSCMKELLLTSWVSRSGWTSTMVEWESISTSGGLIKKIAKLGTTHIKKS